jgi:poly-gamma-glutamate synthesis protein (capsule biosynthesis protein)
VGIGSAVRLAALTLWVGFAGYAQDGGGFAPSSPSIVVIFGGDVTLGYHYEEYFDDQLSKGRTRDEMLAYPFKELNGRLRAADLAVVNLECPFTARGEKIPKNFNFRARPELVSALLAGGVGAVSVANNHMMDYGPVGLFDTMETLDLAKLSHFGAGRTLLEARRPAIIERGGHKLALLGYFFLGTHNIEPAEVLATETTPGVAGHPADLKLMKRMLREDVTAARAQADVVIPFFHWGREGNHFPEAYQVELAHLAIDSGAAAVVGSHPHVLQGMELYRGAPIFYSLGNLIFGGNWDPKVKESALVAVRFSSAGYLSTEIIPVQIDRFPKLPIQPFLLDQEHSRQVLQHLAEYSSKFEQMLPELARWKK